MNDRACPACDSQSAILLGIKTGFKIARCERCRSLYNLRLPTQTALYDDHYSDSGMDVPDLVNRRSREIVTTFEDFRKTGTLLDVGCGAGKMLKAAVDAGWEAQGLEIASSAVEELRKQGFQVRESFVEEACYPDSAFDVIVANGVIEHVHHPGPFLVECFRILRPGGLFYVTTPNALGFSARLLGLRWTVVGPDDHVHLFSVSGLRTLLGSHGFRIEKIAAEGANPIELLHALRNRGQESDFTHEDRVGSAYRLNEALLSSRPRVLIKGLINKVLTATRLGDELKIYASK